MLQALEGRITPAAVVHFFEADGDRITVRTNKGSTAQLLATLTDQNGSAITEGATGVARFYIDFRASAALPPAFAGTNLTVGTAKYHRAGNNLVDYVSINAFDGGAGNNIDLGVVFVKGNLVYIDAGDEDLTTPAIRKVDVVSWGPNDIDGLTPPLSSQIRGNIGSINVRKDFDGYIISNNAAGIANYLDFDEGTQIGSITVGRGFWGGDYNDMGHIQVNGIGKLTIKGVFSGQSETIALRSGLIEAGSIGSMSIHEMTYNARIIIRWGA